MLLPVSTGLKRTLDRTVRQCVECSVRAYCSGTKSKLSTPKVQQVLGTDMIELERRNLRSYERSMNFVKTLLTVTFGLYSTHPRQCCTALSAHSRSQTLRRHICHPRLLWVRLHEPHHQIIFRERDRTVALVSTRKANRDGRNQGGYYNATEGRLYPSEHRSHCY